MASPIAQPRWNWQQPDWPNFRWSAPRLARAEEQCLLGTGLLLGAIGHLEDDDRVRVSIESLGADAVASSAIEGRPSIAKACSHPSAGTSGWRVK
jgi:Fic family protein